MHVVIAPDKFKGVLDARAAADAIGRGVRAAHPDARISLVPMADGGEGTLDVLMTALGGNRRLVDATGPRGAAVQAGVGLIRQASCAIIEMAQVCGLSLLKPDQRNPLKTTTFGLGQVIRSAIESGVEEIILCLGGSATVDGGAGMMQALGMEFRDLDGRLITEALVGADLSRIGAINWPAQPEGIEQIRFTIACDVLNPACGPHGAAAVFAPQKGADAAGVALLEKGLAHWADLLESLCGRRIRDEPGAGAAGGVALPLLAFLGASLMPGVDLVSEAVSLASKIADADLVITGEGCLDRQSMMGKVVGAVGRMARAVDVSCIAIVGTTGAGVDDCLNALDGWRTLNGPVSETAQRLEDSAARVAQETL
jgi:glycerate kinase